MNRLTKCGVIGFMGAIFAVAGAETGRLPADQLAKAVRTDSISIPTSGELFAALEKPGKTNWSGQYRGPMPMTYRDRSQRQPAGQKHRVRHHQALESAGSK